MLQSGCNCGSSFVCAFASHMNCAQLCEYTYETEISTNSHKLFVESIDKNLGDRRPKKKVNARYFAGTRTWKRKWKKNFSNATKLNSWTMHSAHNSRDVFCIYKTRPSAYTMLPLWIISIECRKHTERNKMKIEAFAYRNINNAWDQQRLSHFETSV